MKRSYRLPVFSQANGYNSDISIMVLESRVKFSKDVQPACLPSANIAIKPSSQAIVSLQCIVVR